MAEKKRKKKDKNRLPSVKLLRMKIFKMYFLYDTRGLLMT
jgi:hypothetical protein